MFAYVLAQPLRLGVPTPGNGCKPLGWLNTAVLRWSVAPFASVSPFLVLVLSVSTMSANGGIFVDTGSSSHTIMTVPFSMHFRYSVNVDGSAGPARLDGRSSGDA